MNILSDIYSKSLAESDKNIRFWENYLQNLKSLDFSTYAEKLKVPVLVPIGSRIFFRGELKHTNEVTVALGADYFAKCSLKQAEVLWQHRIRDAQSKLDTFKKEKLYLENRLSFNKNIFYDEGQEIIEDYSEEEEKAWRKKHRENMKEYKLKENKEQTNHNKETETTDEELWNRLEALELQEELENELLKNNRDDVFDTKLEKKHFDFKEKHVTIPNEMETIVNEVKEEEELFTDKTIPSKQTAKFDLLQQVIDKQNELQEKLMELKNKERIQTTTENDLITRLDEMEQLEDVEDEMDRLDDILETEDIEDTDEESTSISHSTSLKRSVSFADEEESETLEITFKHSDVAPCEEPYNPEKGILKPRDIYTAYPNLLSGETTSILKKTKYENDLESCIEYPKDEKKKKKVGFQEPEEVVEVNKTIVINDVVEKVVKENNKLQDTGSRPSSLFMKRRQLNNVFLKLDRKLKTK